MRTFQPSPEFRAFFDQVIAAAEAPVTAGSFSLTVPTFASPEEQAFVQAKLVPLIGAIDTYRRSVIPPAVGPAPMTEEQMLWMQASSGAP